MPVGEEDYCEPCFRRQYLLRSAIEHFMVSTFFVACSKLSHDSIIVCFTRVSRL